MGEDGVSSVASARELGRLPQPYFLYGEDSRPTMSGAQQERCGAIAFTGDSMRDALLAKVKKSNRSHPKRRRGRHMTRVLVRREAATVGRIR